LSVLYITMIQKQEKMFDQLLSSLRSILRNNKIVSMAAPSIIGLLPMPGGALVSAPLVEKTTEKMAMSGEFKTFLNYWFRHIWEFVWPIYAGLLLFEAMSGIPLKKIILAQAPYTILNIISGVIILSLYMRKNNIPNLRLKNTSTIKRTAADFLWGIWPVLIIIILFFALSVPLYISLVLTSVLLTLIKKIRLKNIMKMLFSPLMGKTMLLITSVLVFQRIIYLSNVFGSAASGQISFSFLIFLCFLISFSIGFLTGVNTAYIAISYPILLPLIQHLPNFFDLSIYIYVIGFSGILLSPVHLCLVLTNEYFNSNLLKVYKYLFPPVFLLMILSTLLVVIT
ncbi:MAG: DUF401 family protein, partial [Candidatus Aminicenantes bacterium]|nr:DUF401 family protein [Candidatus Aminicenantes bacterium]